MVLRGPGFVAILADIHAPVALMIPYVALTIAFALGDLGISRGAIIAPPAFMVDAVTALVKRVAERTAQFDGGNAMIGARSCDLSNLRLLGGSPPSWAMILVAMIDFIKMPHNSTPFALLRT
jgi:hypothetical protein